VTEQRADLLQVVVLLKLHDRTYRSSLTRTTQIVTALLSVPSRRRDAGSSRKIPPPSASSSYRRRGVSLGPGLSAAFRARPAGLDFRGAGWSHADGRVRVLCFLSRISVLLYEVVWARLLHLLFGDTVLAVSTVLASFMAGLALGGFWIGRFIVYPGGCSQRELRDPNAMT
jgi:hypothetical protein